MTPSKGLFYMPFVCIYKYTWNMNFFFAAKEQEKSQTLITHDDAADHIRTYALCHTQVLHANNW